MSRCRTCRFWDATPQWRIQAPAVEMGPSEMKRVCHAVPPTPWIDPDGNQQELYPMTFAEERCGLWQAYEARLSEVLAHAQPSVHSQYRIKPFRNLGAKEDE